MALNYAYAMLGTAFVCTGMVMDEEVLVLYCFVLFVALAYHYASAAVDESIKGEASKISKEFDAFFDIQKKVIKTLINYHILQVLAISQLKGLLSFSKGEITKVLKAKKSSLDSALVTQMEQKFSLLAGKEQTIAQAVQVEASVFITSKIYAVFTSENKEKSGLKAKILSENMKKLESLSSN